MCRHVFARRFQHGRGTTNEALRSQGLSSGYVIQGPRVISHLFLQDLFKTLDWGFRNPSILYSNGMGREKVGSASRINAADSTCFDRRTPYGKHETHTGKSGVVLTCSLPRIKGMVSPCLPQPPKITEVCYSRFVFKTFQSNAILLPQPCASNPPQVQSPPATPLCNPWHVIHPQPLARVTERRKARDDSATCNDRGHQPRVGMSDRRAQETAQKEMPQDS